MQSIGQALLTVYNPNTNNNDRKCADLFLNSIKESENGFIICIELFAHSTENGILFYCLLVIEYTINVRWDSLEPRQIATLNKLFLSFMADFCSNKLLFANLAPHIKKKTAQMMALLMVCQYLSSWPCFFKDLIGLLRCNSDGICEMYLLVLCEISWLIHENDSNVLECVVIRDQMRVSDVALIVETWYVLLSNYNCKDGRGFLVKLCLETMDKYIAWIDIALTCSHRFVSLFYSFLSNDSLFGNECVDCLYEIVTKRMDPSLKLNLLNSMQIMRVVSGISLGNANMRERVFAESVTGLIAGIGMQLIGCCRDRLSDSDHLLRFAYKMGLKCFAHPSLTVSCEIIDFLREYWVLVSHISYSFSSVSLLFSKTIELISSNLCYPSQYNVEFFGEFEAEFDWFRCNLLDKLVGSMALAYAFEMTDLVENHFVRQIHRLAHVKWQEMESDLHIIYVISAKENDTFLENAFSNSIYSHFKREPKVVLKLMDLIDRYNAFFVSHTEYIGNALSIFLDSIASPNAQVRTHGSYRLHCLISKLYRFKSEKVNSVLMQCMDSLIQSLMHALTQTHSINDDSKVNICTVLGQLIANNQECSQMIEIGNNVCSNLNSKQAKSTSPFVCVSCIECCNSVFKAFTPDNIRNGNIARQMRMSCEIAMKSYYSFPNNTDLRRVSICFIHKCQYILKCLIFENGLLSKALQRYVLSLDEHNCVLTLQIISDIVSNLAKLDRTNMQTVLVGILDPMIASVYKLLESDDCDHHTKSDIISHYYVFLLRIFENGCHSSILNKSDNKEGILNSVLDGCLKNKFFKTCFHIFKELLLNCSDPQMKPQIKDLFCNRVNSKAFDFAFSKHFRAKDANYRRALKIHIFKIHYAMFGMFGEEYVAKCIVGCLVNQFNVEEGIAIEYCRIARKKNKSKQLFDIILNIRKQVLLKSNECKS